MQEKRLRLRTYRQVWRLEQVIYQIERVRLPFPVTFRQIGIFGAVLLVMAVISPLPGLSALSPVLRYGLLPGLSAWYLTARRLDGKQPHRWVLSMLRYWGAPKRLNRLKPMPAPERVQVKAALSYRVSSADRPEVDAEG